VRSHHATGWPIPFWRNKFQLPNALSLLRTKLTKTLTPKLSTTNLDGSPAWNEAPLVAAPLARAPLALPAYKKA